MKRFVVAMLVCLSCASRAQDEAAVLAHGAVHCLTAKKFLPTSRVEKMMFGSILDEKSYPGKKVLYVVNYPNPSRPDGFVYTLFLNDRDGRQDFNIQNNARFTRSKGGVDGVSFVDPPLGGTWTQEHLVSAIKKIEKLPRFIIAPKDMLTMDSSVSCEAYTDAQPKSSAK